MEETERIIRERRSVRTFDSRALSKEELDLLKSFVKTITNPFHIPVEFRFLEQMSCPVVVGTSFYAAAKVKHVPYFNEAFGYSFERLFLFAHSLGLGTVWIGGTMDRKSFEKEMELEDDELMPCVTPLGVPKEKMSLREIMMRKGIKADERRSFEEIAYIHSFECPLSKDDAKELFLPIEMVRLAPSAVNRQPWRLLVKENAVHFYLERSKGFSGETLDMQKIDMGIALCHFELMANEIGIKTAFIFNEPDITAKEGMEYIGSYLIEKEHSL